MVNYYDKNNKKNQILDESVSIYVCGPTVYNHVHIGNLRPILFFSVLRNIFKYQKKEVRLLQNITDVDDKILNYAKENNFNWKDVAQKYTKSYLQLLENMQIKDVEFYLATDYMKPYVEAVDKLMKQDLAYKNQNGVYIRVNKILKYGQVSNQNISKLFQNVRILNENDKENDGDFALLKNDEMYGWDTKYGKVRPGWHLECFGIINTILEEDLTIHGGGIDLIFPHHENENALNLALYNKPLAKHWIHVGLLTLDGEKMSKSLGNIILAKDFYKKYGANVLKFVFLQNTYSKPINITDQLINQQVKFENNLKSLLTYLKIYESKKDYVPTNYINEFNKLIETLSLPNIYSLLTKIQKDFNKNLINESDFYSVKIDLETILHVLDINLNINVSKLDFENISKLNKTLDINEINIINCDKIYIKTRKGWTKK